RAWANGLITGAAPLGMATAHVLFGYLIGAYTWRTAFVITGSFTALLALVWTWYGRNRPSEHSAVNEAELQLIQADTPLPARPSDIPGQAVLKWSGWGSLLCNRSLLLLTLSYAAVGYFEYLFIFCTEHYFKGILKIDEDTSRTYATIGNLAMVMTMPLGG